MRTIDCAGRPLKLGRIAVMGILNVTPDSFSDGGEFRDPERAIARAVRMVEEGADLLDVGGESTRPGATPVSASEEMDRVLPVLEGLRDAVRVPVSVDTSKPEVMRAAVRAGAGMVNDVLALRTPESIETIAGLGVPVCLMHLQGEPRTMQQNPVYKNVVEDVCRFLDERVSACEKAGIPRSRLLVDPGFGFGKTLSHNLDLLRNLRTVAGLGAPVVAGLSRKSLIGMATGLPVERRLHASVTLAMLAAQHGARVLRVHDVGPTVEALRMLEAAQPELVES